MDLDSGMLAKELNLFIHLSNKENYSLLLFMISNLEQHRPSQVIHDIATDLNGHPQS